MGNGGSGCEFCAQCSSIQAVELSAKNKRINSKDTKYQMKKTSPKTADNKIEINFSTVFHS